MVIDHEVDVIDRAEEVVRLHVDHRHALVLGDLCRRDDVDVDVEQIRHPDVLRPGDTLQRRDDGGLLGPAQDVAQRQPAADRVRIGVVVQQDEDALGVAEEALVLLDPQARQRAAEFGQQRAAEQLRQRQVTELRILRLQFLFAFVKIGDADPQHVNERASRVPDRREHLLEAAAAAVLHDHAGAGRDVGFDVGVGAAGVDGGHAQPRLVEPAGERLALDEKVDFEAGQQDLIEHPDDQLGLADGEASHGMIVAVVRAWTIGGNF